MKNMINNFTYKIVDFIFSNSYLFNSFRNIIHNNFKEDKLIISKYFINNKKTLDFGCGMGQFSILFDKDKYYGIDTDKEYIDFCKKKNKGNFSLIKEVPPYNFQDKEFEQIIVFAVIHHINDKVLKSIFEEFYRILKKNGRIIIMDHFIKKDQRNFFCRFLINFDRGRYFRNPDNIISLLKKRFEVEKQFIRKGLYKDYILIFKKKL